MEENLLMKALFAYWTSNNVISAFKGGVENGEVLETKEIPYASVQELRSQRMLRTAKNNYRLVTWDVIIIAETQKEAVDTYGELIRTSTEEKESSLTLDSGFCVQEIRKEDSQLVQLQNKWEYTQSFSAKVSRSRT